MPSQSNPISADRIPSGDFRPQLNRGHPEESVQELEPAEFAFHLTRFARQHREPRVSFALNATPPIEGSTILDPPRIMFGLDGKFPLIFSGTDDRCLEPLAPGSIVFVCSRSWTRPLWESHACTIGNIVFHRTFTRFTVREWNGRAASPSSNRFLHSPAPFGGVINHLVAALETQAFSASQPNQTSQWLLQALFSELRERLEELAVQPPALPTHHQAASTWRAIASYVEEHYHEPINLMNVAEHFSMNADHISRLFKQVGGENFNKFLTRLRMRKAEYLLRNYHLSVEDIAVQCGFRESGYFRKVFTRHLGTTPTRYRHSCRRIQNM